MKKPIRENNECENIKNDLGDCLSEITQIHFYFISSNIARSLWLFNIDRFPSADSYYRFSREKKEPRFKLLDIEKLFYKNTIYKEEDGKSFSVGELLRNGWCVNIRQTVIFEIDATIEYYIRKKKYNLNFLNKSYFYFFKQAHEALHHSHSQLNKLRTGERKIIKLPNGVNFDTGSRKFLKLSDKKIHELLLLINRELAKTLIEMGGEVDKITQLLQLVLKTKELK